MLVTLDPVDPYLLHPANGKTAVIINQDTLSSIITAPDSGSLTLASPNADLIAPQSFIITDGSVEVWGTAQDGTPQVSIQEGVPYWGVSPGATATALIAAGIPAAIAQAIAAGGISLLGNPSLLYSIQQPSAVGTNLVGATVNPGVYQLDQQVSSNWIAAANKFDGYVGRPMALTVMKFFLQSSVPSAFQLAAMKVLGAAGCALLVTFKPAQDPAQVYGAAWLAGQGGTERANIASVISTLQGFNITFKASPYNEPNLGTNFPNAAAYIAYHNFYAVPIQAAGIKCCYVPSLPDTPNGSWLSFYPGNSTVDEIYADYYGNSFRHGVLLDNAGGATPEGIEHFARTNNKPFGLGEWGLAANKFTFTATDWENYAGYLETVFGNRISSNLQNGWIIYYGGNAYTPPTPPGINVVLGPTDPKVVDPLGISIPDVYDDLSIISGTNVPANSFITATPNKPSPIAGFAVANGLSYDILIQLIAGVSSTSPFADITLRWFNTDNPNAIPVDVERWTIPMGTNGTGGTQIFGKGPQRGQFLSVSIRNKDTVACAVSMQLNSTSRPVSRDDWRWDANSSVTVPGYTLPSGGSYDNELGAVSPSVAVGNTSTFIFGMFAGRIFIRANSSQTSNILVKALPTGSTLLNENFGGASPEFETTVTFPRGVCSVALTNNGSATATINCIAILDDSG